MDFIESDIFLVALTFGVYFGAMRLRDITGVSAFHPVLVTVAVLIGFLQLTGISYETYSRPGHMIEFWLKPAIVALGLPLYTQLKVIRKQFIPILMCELAGCVVGIISVVLIAKWMGSLARGHNIARAQIGDQCHSHRDYRPSWRHTFTHGIDSGACRFAWSRCRA